MDSAKHALEPVTSALERFLNDPVNHDYLTLVKAMRNGIVYGTKVRFPHALVMTFLFKTGTLKSKIKTIVGATRQHATNLMMFACTYKALMIFMHSMPSKTPSPPSKRDTALPLTTKPFRKETTVDSFIAGLVAGYIVFGRGNKGKSGVNQQIVLYVFARVAIALAKLAIAPPAPRPAALQAGYGSVSRRGGGLLERVLGGADQAETFRRLIKKNTWAVFASVSWGMVMWLFRWHPDLLQPSLRSSMTYLYEDCAKWDGLRTFLLYNNDELV